MSENVTWSVLMDVQNQVARLTTRLYNKGILTLEEKAYIDIGKKPDELLQNQPNGLKCNCEICGVIIDQHDAIYDGKCKKCRHGMKP